MPVTGFANKPDSVPDLLKMVGGAPVVIKLLQGTQGIGVVLAETRTAAESVIEAFMGLKADILVQEFIKEAGGADIRCFVIGDKVIAAMKRQGADGEFRSTGLKKIRPPAAQKPEAEDNRWHELPLKLPAFKFSRAPVKP